MQVIHFSPTSSRIGEALGITEKTEQSSRRARHERGRPRTRDRALLTLQRLADALSAPGPPRPGRRLRLAFAVAQPLGVTLKKELGEGLIASGLVGAHFVGSSIGSYNLTTARVRAYWGEPHW